MKIVEPLIIQRLEDIGEILAIMKSQNCPKCSECNYGKWHNKFEKKNWSEYGTEKLLEWENKNDGSMLNATEYFKKIGVIK